MRFSIAQQVTVLLGMMCLASGAHGAFTGIQVQSKGVHSLGGGARGTLQVFNIWASFSSPTDTLLSVTGAQWGISSGSAQLYQHHYGIATAPWDILIAINPATALDSFVTIGKKSTALGADGTTLEAGAGFWGPGGTSGFQGGWFNADPDNGQGNPTVQPFGTPGQFHVLIAQLSFRNIVSPYTAGGSMIVAWKSATSGSQFSPTGLFIPVFFPPPIPAPGALALLAIAGLAPRRRR